MIEEAAKRLYEIVYMVREFAIKHPNGYMPDKWGDLPDEIKANYCEDAQQIHQLFEPEESTVKLPQAVGDCTGKCNPSNGSNKGGKR